MITVLEVSTAYFQALHLCTALLLSALLFLSFMLFVSTALECYAAY